MLSNFNNYRMRNTNFMEKDSLQSSGVGDPEIMGINQKPSAGTIEDIPTLDQNFNLLSACSLGLSSGNAWAVFGASIVRKQALRRAFPSSLLSRLHRFTMVGLLVCSMNSEFSTTCDE